MRTTPGTFNTLSEKITFAYAELRTMESEIEHFLKNGWITDREAGQLDALLMIKIAKLQP